MNQREKLAEAQHNIWSHWMVYVFSVCRELEDGSCVIPSEYVLRWHRQMNTVYPELSDAEKASDREQAAKILEVLDL